MDEVHDSGQRIASLVGMAGFDKSVYGDDVDKIKIRGSLEFYHSRSLNFADAAGPLHGKPGSNRLCPGRSASVSMATQFLKAMDLSQWELIGDESVEFGDSPPSFFQFIQIAEETIWEL